MLRAQLHNVRSQSRTGLHHRVMLLGTSLLLPGGWGTFREGRKLFLVMYKGSNINSPRGGGHIFCQVTGGGCGGQMCSIDLCLHFKS